MTESRTLLEELNDLHTHYVEAINIAVEENDHRRAEQLGAAYDLEAIQLVAEREGKTHLLPLILRRRNATVSPLRRLVTRLSSNRAA